MGHGRMTFERYRYIMLLYYSSSGLMSRDEGPRMPERTRPFDFGRFSDVVVAVSAHRSGPKRTSGICPLEGFGHRIVKVTDESQDPILEFLGGCEAASLEELSSQDREPDLDLIHPGSVFRGVHELDSV